MIFLFFSYVVITHLINLQVSFTCFSLVHLILGLSVSSLVTLQSWLMCCLSKPFPPQKPHILLVVLLHITYDHTHLKVDLHPPKTNAIHPEIIILVRIFECRIQIHRAFICGTMSGDTGKDYHHLTCDLIETFWDHSPQDQVVETPKSKSQMIDNATL